jgi:hypothetical protein
LPFAGEADEDSCIELPSPSQIAMAVALVLSVAAVASGFTTRAPAALVEIESASTRRPWPPSASLCSQGTKTRRALIESNNVTKECVRTATMSMYNSLGPSTCLAKGCGDIVPTNVTSCIVGDLNGTYIQQWVTGPFTSTGGFGTLIALRTSGLLRPLQRARQSTRARALAPRFALTRSAYPLSAPCVRGRGGWLADWWFANIDLHVDGTPDSNVFVGAWGFTYHAASAETANGYADEPLTLPPLHNHHAVHATGSPTRRCAHGSGERR